MNVTVPHFNITLPTGCLLQCTNVTDLTTCTSVVCDSPAGFEVWNLSATWVGIGLTLYVIMIAICSTAKPLLESETLSLMDEDVPYVTQVVARLAKGNSAGSAGPEIFNRFDPRRVAFFSMGEEDKVKLSKVIVNLAEYMRFLRHETAWYSNFVRWAMCCWCQCVVRRRKHKQAVRLFEKLFHALHEFQTKNGITAVQRCASDAVIDEVKWICSQKVTYFAEHALGNGCCA